MILLLYIKRHVTVWNCLLVLCNAIQQMTVLVSYGFSLLRRILQFNCLTTELIISRLQAPYTRKNKKYIRSGLSPYRV